MPQKINIFKYVLIDFLLLLKLQFCVIIVQYFFSNIGPRHDKKKAQNMVKYFLFGLRLTSGSGEDQAKNCDLEYQHPAQHCLK